MSAHGEPRTRSAGLHPAGAIVVRVAEQVRPISVQECVRRVLAPPRACREVDNVLTALAEGGGGATGEHAALIAVIERLARARAPAPSGARPRR